MIFSLRFSIFFLGDELVNGNINLFVLDALDYITVGTSCDVEFLEVIIVASNGRVTFALVQVTCFRIPELGIG
jgi:hypothetical protein